MRLSFKIATKAALAVTAGILAVSASAQKNVSQTGTGQMTPSTATSASFLENRGQWDPRVKFMATQGNLAYWVTESGLTLELSKVQPKDGAARNKPGEPIDFDQYQKVGHVVKLNLVGGNTRAAAQGVEPTGFKADFLVGDRSQHARGVRAFGEAYLKDVYPGVHLRNYLAGGLRYDFIVMPGANAAQIAMNVEGASSVKLDDKGGLVIGTTLGDITSTKPVVYQVAGDKQIPVEASFNVSGDRVGFKLGAYDKKLPLIIDPLVYGSYLGSNSVPFFSSGFEQVLAVRGVADGDLYAVGQTSSVTFPVNAGPFGLGISGGTDTFLVRMDGDAYALDYAAFVGGAGTDIARGVGFSESTNQVIFAGTTTSVNFPGAVNAFGGPTASIFTTRFSVDPTNGDIQPLFSRYMTEIGNVLPTGNPTTQAAWSDFEVAPNGMTYIAGTAQNATLLANGFVVSLAGMGGGRDGFVLPLNSDGSLSQGVIIGSTSNDTMGQIGVRNPFSFVVTGTVGSVGNQDTAVVANPIFPTSAGVFLDGRLLRNNDAFVVAVDWLPGTGWTTRFSALLGGAAQDRAIAATFDDRGDIYVLGATASFDFPRTRGAFDEDFGNEAFVTKILANGSEIVYSTGLQHNETVIPTVIKADKRGIAVIGGTVGWRPGNPPFPSNTIPGSIPTTPDALDGAYTGGVESADGAGSPATADTQPATTDGFIQFLSAAGNSLLYSDFIGQNSNDSVNDVFVDGFGAAWIAGTHTPAATANGALKTPIGVAPYITGDAFKDTADAGSTDAFIIKLRVGLPILNSITFNPGSVAGGLGASSTATVRLLAPAPVGGVNVALNLDDATIASFSATSSQANTVMTFAQGEQVKTITVFTLPVNAQSTVELRGTLDNDFKIARLVVNPWLDEFTITPSSVVGGNQLSARVRLFQTAVNPVRVTLTSNRPDLVLLPNPAEIVVPAGATSATIPLDTVGVDTDENGTISASLLGVTRAANFALTPAKLIGLTFNPDRVLASETSNLTYRLDGKASTARNVTISYVAGAPGLKINGQDLPVVVTIPAQATQGTALATTPIVAASTSTTVRATAGAESVDATLLIDDIDIAGLSITPATDVISGTVLQGRVTLTRPAGVGGFNVNISSSNAAAGTLSSATVTVPAGQTTSNAFNFNAAIVAADQVTAITASRPGFTNRTVNVTVRKISVAMILTPNRLTGGQGNSTATITLSAPAPAAGLTVQVTSSLPAAAQPSNPTVTFASGQTQASATITTNRVATDQNATITAQLAAGIEATAILQVLAPAVTSITVTPGQIVGGNTGTGTVTVSPSAPNGGMVINLAANPASAVTIPTTVTIPAGQTTGTFTVGTGLVLADTDVVITASGSSTVQSTTIKVLAASVSSLTFNPKQVRGGQNATGIVALNQPAPTGGVTVTIASTNTTFARPTVTTVVIPAGSLSATFPVTTSRVSRTLGVTFTATVGTRSATGFLYLRP